MIRSFTALLIIVCALLLSEPSFAKTRVLTVYYTGAINGELEPCGCSPDLQSGGLSRLAEFIKGERAAKKDFILIDAGNSAGKFTAQGRLKTEALTEAFSKIGFDAIADYAADASSAEFQSGLFAKFKLPVLKGATSDSKGQGMVVEPGGIKVNISTDPGVIRKGAVNILLTDKKTADIDYKGWDVIITSSGETLESPVKKNNATVVSGFERGRKIGVLKLAVNGAPRASFVSHEWRALPLNSPEDPGVRKILKAYDLAVADLMKDEEARKAESGPYLGSASCKECHAPHFESYSSTRHPKAFEDLAKAGKSKDPECVVCHTTGYSQQGGFISVTSTPHLAGVGCESCHGPGKAHLEDFSTQVFRGINVETCLKCHTPDNSPGFAYDTYRKKILHQPEGDEK